MSAYRIRIAGLAGAAALAVVAVLGVASFANESAFTDAGTANTKAAGISLPDKLSPQWRETTVAQGSTPLENPSALTNWYGYFNDGPMVPAPGAVQAKGHNVEATKTEPDKNTYLVLRRADGADADIRLRHAFPLPGSRARYARRYITRINLDADAAHRVTHAGRDRGDGTTPVPQIDGSTWDPLAHRCCSRRRR